MIIDFTGKEWQCECLGCALGSGEIRPPGGYVYESEGFIMHQDPVYAIPGFLIVSPKRHVRSIDRLEPPERHELMELMSAGIRALHELHITGEVTVVQEERSKHLHVWLFPWHKWMDERQPHGIQFLRSLMEYWKQNCTQSDIEETLQVVESVRDYLKMVIFQ